MSDAEIDEVYPEDDVPADLHMQEIVVDTSRKELTPEEFHDWLHEGKLNCDVAQALLHAWVHHLASPTDNGIIDLFHHLLYEGEADDITIQQHIHLPLPFLAAFALRHCSFAFDVPGGCQDTQEAYIPIQEMHSTPIVTCLMAGTFFHTIHTRIRYN